LSSSSTDLAKDRELEKKRLEAAQVECRQLLGAMREVQPAAAEQIKSRLDALFKRHPKLPLDFKHKILTDARSHECVSNMRAADAALHQALSAARHDDHEVRNRMVSEARIFSSKASALGANKEFKAAVQRKLEIVMMTGGVEHKGPTIAKPLSNRSPLHPSGPLPTFKH
jgi:ribosomal protein L16 Arg81 hydroxylase